MLKGLIAIIVMVWLGFCAYEFSTSFFDIHKQVESHFYAAKISVTANSMQKALIEATKGMENLGMTTGYFGFPEHEKYSLRLIYSTTLDFITRLEKVKQLPPSDESYSSTMLEMRNALENYPNLVTGTIVNRCVHKYVFMEAFKDFYQKEEG